MGHHPYALLYAQPSNTRAIPHLHPNIPNAPLTRVVTLPRCVPLDTRASPVSRVANQDEKASAEEAPVIAETFGVDPTLEIELSRQMRAGELVYASNTGWSVCEEGSCYVLDPTRGGGGDGSEAGGAEASKLGPLASFNLPEPQQLLNNCWCVRSEIPPLSQRREGAARESARVSRALFYRMLMRPLLTPPSLSLFRAQATLCHVAGTVRLPPG